MSKKTPKTPKEPKAAKGAKAPKDAKAAPKVSDKIVKLECTRTLPCALDQKELAKCGQDLGSNLDKIAALQEKKKAEDKAINGDIALLEEANGLLRSRIRDKSSEREVHCIQETDYRMGEIRVKRLDTGETFSKRTMNKEELQLPLEAQKPAGKLLAMDGGKGKQITVEEVSCEECWGTGKVQIGDPPLDAKCEGCMGSGKVAPKKDPLTAKLGDVAAQHEKNKAATEEAPAQEGDGHPEVEKAIAARGKGKKQYKGLGTEVDTSHGPDESF